MELIKFDDYCRVLRVTGERDELDNEQFETLYDDKCSYQEGGQTALSIISRDDMVYFPEVVSATTNDIVEAVTQSGRKERGVVKKARDIILPVTGEKFTVLELKQASEE
jgi:hypothetical protein